LNEELSSKRSHADLGDVSSCSALMVLWCKCSRAVWNHSPTCL